MRALNAEPIYFHKTIFSPLKNRFLKRLITSVARPAIQFYLQKDRAFTWKKTRIVVNKGVFHPGLFFSTISMLRFLKDYNVANSSLLELGCGSGLISVMMAKQGAEVTASDINPEAIKCTAKNAVANKVEIKTLLSDLFDSIPEQVFDYIVINPPFYRKKPDDINKMAWYSGEELEYFKKLFRQVSNYTGEKTMALMVLSDACDLSAIKNMATENGIKFELLKKYYRWIEWNYIFKISKTG